jgi:glycine C-acetyltransferase/8-amino-7-oxononanoate synthase
MDGDVAPLQELVELAQHRGIRLAVDEAHATGTLGPDGRGALVDAGVEDQVDVIVGTLGKALGSYGAFAACDRQMARYLLNSARTLIFSTAPPPPAAAGALAALELLRERPRLVQKLRSNAGVLRSELRREGFDVDGPGTQIIPLLVGDPSLAVEICDKALAGGVFAQAIRPPTVPAMTSRLRLAAMASHREEELRTAARTLAEAARAAGFEPRALSATADHLEYDVDERPPAGITADGADALPAGVFDVEDESAMATSFGGKEEPVLGSAARGVFDFEDDTSVARAA